MTLSYLARVAVAIAGLAAVVAPPLLDAQARSAAAGVQGVSAPAGVGVEIVPVTPDTYMLAGAGGNVTVNVGSEGLFVVDTGSEAMSESVVRAIRTISDRPLRFIVNTGIERDHTGGNRALNKELGRGILTRETTDPGAVILAHENAFNRMSAATAGAPAMPAEAWPNLTFFVAQHDLRFNDQAVQLLHMPAARTDGDIVVVFRRSDVIATGAIFDKTRYPVIDIERGGSIDGVIDAMNRLLEIAVAGSYEEGGTMIVPGRGRLSDESDVGEYRQMLTIVRDRIRDMVQRGLALEAVKAARPTFEYDPEYGPSDTFVEAVYRSLRARSR